MPGRKSSPARKAASRTQPNANRTWWLGEGDQDCPHCDQTYSYEIEARCTVCDGPICLHCVMRADEGVVCPDCGASAG